VFIIFRDDETLFAGIRWVAGNSQKRGNMWVMRCLSLQPEKENFSKERGDEFLLHEFCLFKCKKEVQCVGDC